MIGENGEVVSFSDETRDELREVLQKIPDDILIGVIAERIQCEPDKEEMSVSAISQKTFSGPIPPPSMLEGYDKVHDGLADRIVSMAESQQQHRQALEYKSVEAAIKTESRGQHYALLVSVVIISGAIYLIDNGKEIAGSILAGGTLTGLAYMFITGRRKKSIPTVKDADA